MWWSEQESCQAGTVRARAIIMYKLCNKLYIVHIRPGRGCFFGEDRGGCLAQIHAGTGGKKSEGGDSWNARVG